MNNRTTRRIVLAASLLVFVPLPARAADESPAVKGDKPGAAAPAAQGEGAVAVFNGKDTSGWKLKNAAAPDPWKVVADVAVDPKNARKLVGTGDAADGKGVLFMAGTKGSDIYTEQAFGDCEVHVEFNIPDASNSGVYLMGNYEVQILSSFQKPIDKLGPGDCGGIYNTKAPSSNPLLASKPGDWQTFDIVFHAPRFDKDGKKIENAKFVSVSFNGQKIHDNVEAPKPTGSQLPGGEKPTGPIMLQGDHGTCAFRNVRVKPLAAAAQADEK